VPIDVRLAHERDIDDLVEIRRAADAISHPDDPPLGRDELLLRLFQSPSRKPKRVVIARIDDHPTGLLALAFPQGVNEDHVEAYAIVRPHDRHRGAALALLRHGFESIAGDRRLISSWIEPGEGVTLAEGLGLTERQVVRESRLAIADLDDDQQLR
jgi:hypothetical protein